MFEQTLPRTLDPRRLAEQAVTLEGTLPLSGFLRLREYLVKEAILSRKIKGTLSFSFGVGGVILVNGRIEAQLPLQCQRCLDTMDYDASVDLLLGLVRTKNVQLMTGYEPYQMEDDRLCIQDLIEGELILHLPLVARHSEQDCHLGGSGMELPQNEAEKVKRTKKHPFEALNALKADKTLGED